MLVCTIEQRTKYCDVLAEGTTITIVINLVVHLPNSFAWTSDDFVSINDAVKNG